jgi:pimeloyl-ACP methyl ester carboxylesterase
LKTEPAVVHNDFSACNRFDVMDRLHAIRLPSLVICAAQDRMTPVKYGAYLQDHIPGAKMAVIEGAGHMMGLEQEKIFIDRVRRFVGPFKDPAGR